LYRPKGGVYDDDKVQELHLVKMENYMSLTLKSFFKC